MASEEDILGRNEFEAAVTGDPGDASTLERIGLIRAMMAHDSSGDPAISCPECGCHDDCVWLPSVPSCPQCVHNESMREYCDANCDASSDSKETRGDESSDSTQFYLSLIHI